MTAQRVRVQACRRALEADLEVPGDKSVSHRALILAALARGTSRIRGLAQGRDVASTRQALERLGVEVREGPGGWVEVCGRGVGGLAEPEDVIDCGNSGTTMRLLAGVLAGHGFLSVLTGDASLRGRPMARVLDPLREMGALAIGRAEDSLAPLVIRGGPLRAVTWRLPVASAQVKSAVLLAGLHARGTTWVEEPVPTRDHTERMLLAMGAQVMREPGRVGVRGRPRLRPLELEVPGDPSSAAFWAAAALVVPGSRVRIRGVLLNPTRTGFFRLLERMGADLAVEVTGEAAGEPVGTIEVCHGRLRGIEVGPADVPAAIDELPLLGVVAAKADGVTTVRGAGELRHKESDRIEALASELAKAGARVEAFPDGFRVHGGAPLRAARFESHGDHRIAMAMAVLALGLPGESEILGAGAADVSYPGFWDVLERVGG